MLRPITVVFSKFQRYFIAFAKFQQNKILYNHFWALTKTESKPSSVKKSTSDPAPRTYVWVKKIIISLHKNNNVSFLLSVLRFVFRARRVSLFVYYLKINKNKGSPPPSLFIWFSIFLTPPMVDFPGMQDRESHTCYPRGESIQPPSHLK